MIQIIPPVSCLSSNNFGGNLAFFSGIRQWLFRRVASATTGPLSLRTTPLIRGITSFLSSLNLSSNIKHWLQLQSTWDLTPPHILQRGECLESGGRRSWRGHDCLVTCELDPNNQRLLISFLSLEGMLCPQFSQWELFQESSLERAMCCWDYGWHTWLNPLEGSYGDLLVIILQAAVI